MVPEGHLSVGMEEERTSAGKGKPENNGNIGDAKQW